MNLMACFVAVVVVLLCFLLTMPTVAWLRNNDPVRDAFRSLASRYRGIYEAGGWWRPSGAMFKYAAGVRVKVRRLKSQARPLRYLELMLDWPEGQPQCWLAPIEYAGRVDGACRQWPALSVDAAFNNEYVLRGRSEAASLMSDGVRWKLRQLRAVGGQRDVELAIEGKFFIVRIDGPFRSAEEVEAFVDLGLSLYDQARLTQCRGIDFVQRDVEVLQEARCQVCGEDIITDMVFCSKCRTPHHAECWQYIGRCAVYGCGETQCVAPRVAEPPR